MNELVQSDYPFQFFNEEAFSVDWIMNEFTNAYMAISNYYKQAFPALHTGFIVSKSPDLFKMGVIGRICTLGEDYNTFGFAEEINDDIRSIYFDECDQNIIHTCEFIENFEFSTFGISGFPQDPEYLDRFKHDISLALNMSNLFFMDSMIDIGSLTWFSERYDDEDVPAPFSKEGIDRVFRNVPIVRVW